MSIGVALLVFFVCLSVTLISSEVLVRGLTVLGAKLTWTDGFLGFLTALAADSPEIAAAIAALFAGAADLGQEGCWAPICSILRCSWTPFTFCCDREMPPFLPAILFV